MVAVVVKINDYGSSPCGGSSAGSRIDLMVVRRGLGLLLEDLCEVQIKNQVARNRGHGLGKVRPSFAETIAVLMCKTY